MASERLLTEARASVSEGLDETVCRLHPQGGFEYIFEVFQLAINKEFATLVQFSQTFIFRVTPVQKVENIQSAMVLMKEEADEIRYFEAHGMFKMIVNAIMVKMQNFPTIMAQVSTKLPVNTQAGL